MIYKMHEISTARIKGIKNNERFNLYNNNRFYSPGVWL